MTIDLHAAAANLLAPAVLFFLLGLAAGGLRSDLALPRGASKTLAMFLMMAIGLKGGVEAARAGFDPVFLKAGAAGLILSFGLPVIAFGALTRLKLDRVTAAATAAHYGSVSIVTFIAGTEYLRLNGVEFGGYMVAVVALMETPAIFTALVLAGAGAGLRARGDLFREAALNGSVFLLVGAFFIGMVADDAGVARLSVFVGPVFQGLLLLFLLDLGVTAARKLRESQSLSLPLALFAVAMPMTGCAAALTLAAALGLPHGDAAVLGILAGSASYIAAPAAMRLALPQANPGVYLTLSLGVTFPFNLIVGIPLYSAVAQALNGS